MEQGAFSGFIRKHRIAIIVFSCVAVIILSVTLVVNFLLSLPGQNSVAVLKSYLNKNNISVGDAEIELVGYFADKGFEDAWYVYKFKMSGDRGALEPSGLPDNPSAAMEQIKYMKDYAFRNNVDGFQDFPQDAEYKFFGRHWAPVHGIEVIYDPVNDVYYAIVEV